MLEVQNNIYKAQLAFSMSHRELYKHCFQFPIYLCIAYDK